jgi:PadR family transcriptional regulator, regulatory protein PadR
MNEDKAYEAKLLAGWEGVYKRGQLTLWILLALKDGPKHMSAIKDWVSVMTAGVVSAEDRSLYRALQRFYDVELVRYEVGPGNRGPDRKVYELSPIGVRVLRAFVDRNIALFLKPEVKRLVHG